MTRFRVRAITETAMCTAAALILSYVESLLPFNAVIPIPGFRIGLSNIAVLYLFYENKARSLAVLILKVLLSAFMFGSGISLLFSISGGLLSFCMMLAADQIMKDRISYVGLSAIGGVFHNMGQLIVASAIIGLSAAYTYAPFLILAGVISGACCGLLLNCFAERLKGAIKHSEKTI